MKVSTNVNNFLFFIENLNSQNYSKRFTTNWTKCVHSSSVSKILFRINTSDVISSRFIDLSIKYLMKSIKSTTSSDTSSNLRFLFSILFFLVLKTKNHFYNLYSYSRPTLRHKITFCSFSCTAEYLPCNCPSSRASWIVSRHASRTFPRDTHLFGNFFK